MRVVRARAVVLSVVLAGCFDAGSVDAGSVDAGSVDAGSVDAGSVDAGSVDAGSVDAGIVDGGSADAGVVDAGSADAGQLGGLRGRLWIWARIGPSQPQVYVQAPVGSPARSISAPGRTVTGMAVSDDGSLIAVSYESPSELFVGPTDGGPAQLVRSSIGSIRACEISADRSHVAFWEGYQYDAGALIMPLDGGPAVQVTPRTNSVPGGDTMFSPSSRYFAWIGLNSGWADAYVTDTVTGIMSPVTVPGSDLVNFAWTSDVNFLLVAFSSSTGTSVASLHQCAAPDVCAPLPGFAGTRTLNVSRDRTFAVVGLDSADGGIGSIDIYRAPLDGGAVTLMTTDFRVGNDAFRGLSPDGERFVARSGTTIYGMPTSGSSQPTPLFNLPNGVGAERAAFDLDSTQLLFRSNLEGRGWGLQRLALAPGQPPLLLQDVDGGVVWDFVITP